ncbi:MAG: hypothetical protein R2882_07095 [Gemmatimonadales bacterium]
MAALVLCWPMFTGQFLAGPWSDQFEAGYAFRHFAAEYFRQHHAIPQWNPFLFGGLPFVGAAHGDIFYPTAWLRWFLPTDLAMNLGFAVHIVLAGVTMYGLLRTLKVSWGGAVVGGLGYELTGIVISLVHPGHDGKLFVSALAPLLLYGIVRAVRDRSLAGYGFIALVTGLSLQGHPQAAYYLLVAGAVWGIFWVFGAEGPQGSRRWQVIAGAAGAVALGVGLYAVYALPMAEYVPFSPRGDGGFNTGWAYANSFRLPVEELLGILLPQIDGGATPGYFGANGLKLHSEYVGPMVLMLAVLGMAGGAPERRRDRIALGTIAVLFLLVSIAGATPFFRLWYALMPLAGRLRAPGMAFYLVALPLAAFAGMGADRLVRGDGAAMRRVWIVGGIALALALFAVLGIGQSIAEDIGRSSGAPPEMPIYGAAALKADGLRLLLVAAAGLAAIWAIATGRLKGVLAIGALGLLTVVDLSVVGSRYFDWSPPASVTYAADSVVQRLQATPLPYRVYSPVAGGELGRLNPYPKSRLMGDGVPTLLGYHGNELVAFDDVLGGKGIWQRQLDPRMWQMFAVRFVALSQQQNLPGFHEVVGPISTHHGNAILYEADTIPPYARILTAAAAVPDSEIVPTVADPRYPFEQLVVVPDTSAIKPPPLGSALPDPSRRTATVSEWWAGHIKIAVTGDADRTEYLVVAENWYPDWHAAVDGRAVPAVRGQGTLLTVELPPGAREVTFDFDSSAYHRGKLISLVSLLGMLGLFLGPLARRGRSRGD